MSDHLAFVSKYDSEQWTSALNGFDGWTDHTRDVEESVRKLVLQQKLQGINEMSDLESSLLRSQVSDAILRAIKSEKEKLSQDASSQREAPATKRHTSNDAKSGNVSYGFSVSCLYSICVSCSQCVFFLYSMTVETPSCAQQDSQQNKGKELRRSLEQCRLQCSICTSRNAWAAFSTSTSICASIIWPLPISPAPIQWI